MKTLFRKNDVTIPKLTGSKVIGPKLSSKLGPPFLWMKMVTALVHCAGKVLLLSTLVQIFNINDLKYGHHLKHITDIWYNRHGEPEDFMRLIIRVISW